MAADRASPKGLRRFEVAAQSSPAVASEEDAAESASRGQLLVRRRAAFAPVLTKLCSLFA